MNVTAPDEAVRPQPDPAELRSTVTTVMDGAWRSPGFCVPNPAVYPHQWLWDSCFHALIWAALHRPDRAGEELASTLASTTRAGMVAHMRYWSQPGQHQPLWNRADMSVITQPPMYGHALAQLHRRGVVLDDDTLCRAQAGLHHLLFDRDRTDSGLVPIFHPWESGCDDSPRWDDWRPPEDSVTDWRRAKAGFVGSLVLVAGTPMANPDFTAGSVGFNALVAWNALELLSVIDDEALRAGAVLLRRCVADRWDGGAGTWVDDDGVGRCRNDGSGRVRTLDAMLALLVDPRPEGFDLLVDPDAFGAEFGPCGVDRREPAYDPYTYWRGPAWPQLTYLLTVAAARAGRADVAESLARSLVAGARQSRLSEYWHPDTGLGLGARPQSWTGLALVADELL